MLLKNDGGLGIDLVCHHWEEVLEDGEELSFVAAGDGGDELPCSNQRCYVGR